MLFDTANRASPYHLMLMKFMHYGGQKAYFDTFHWALQCGGGTPPEHELPEQVRSLTTLFQVVKETTQTLPRKFFSIIRRILSVRKYDMIYMKKLALIKFC